MKTEKRRFYELMAYVAVLAMILGSALYMVSVDKPNELFLGGLIPAIPMIIQAISRMGQSDAMNKMADHLAASQPRHTGPRRRKTDKPEEADPEVEQEAA